MLPQQDTHLVSKGNEFEFQRGAASKAESEDGNDREKSMYPAQLPLEGQSWAGLLIGSVTASTS